MKSISTYITCIAIVFTVNQSVAQSINVLELGPDNILFAGDVHSGEIIAFSTNTTKRFENNLYNISDIDVKIASHLGTTADQVIMKDMLVHPVSKQTYLAVSTVVSDTYQSSIVIVSPDGTIETFDTEKNKLSSIKLKNVRDEDFNFLSGMSSENVNITDIDYHNGKLYVSGVSNGTFASTLRVLDYPFSTQSSTSVEMFHTVHGQNETRAPIRTMEIVNLNGTEYLLAAYTCTPLVLIPLSEVKDGGHVVGKTIAELGFGNTPIDFVSFTAMDMNKNAFPAVLLTNKNRNAQLISISEIEKSSQQDGFKKSVGFEPAGTPFMDLPLTNVLHADNLDENHLLTLRRNPETGTLELFHVMKNMYLRLSDFVSEFESPGYEYGANQEQNKQRHNYMKMEEGYPEKVKQ